MTCRTGAVVALVVASFCCASFAGAQPTTGTPGGPVPRQPSPTPPRDMSGRQTTAVVGTATLEGRVVAAETGEPIRRATVTARATRPPQIQGGAFIAPQQYAARTDDDGRFVIGQVVAGEYSVSAQRAGYAPQGYGQLRAMTPARRVSVADGANVDSLDFSLIRSGVVTGRVYDEEGAPAERARVRLLRRQYLRGEVKYVPTAQGTMTDDLGQYRLFGLWPGEYILVADKGEGGLLGPSAVVQAVAVDTVPTYAPGTASLAEADRITVVAGAEVSADVRMVAATVAMVRGKVVSSSGEPFVGALVRLQPTASADVSAGSHGGRTSIDGTFEIASVPPGEYMVIVQSMMQIVSAGCRSL